MKILKTSIRFYFILIPIFLNCAVGPQLSPMQKRQLTTRLINGSYEDTFRGTLTVLQDQGYVIKNTDMVSGLIVATVDRAESGGSQFAQALFLGYVADKGTDIEVSCMLNKITETKTEIRLNIQESKYGQSSAWSGTSKQNTKQIYDPEIYRNLFNEIEIEVKRRQAIAGNAVFLEENSSSDLNENLNDADNNADIDTLFNENWKKPVYLELLGIAKNRYILVSQSDSTNMNVGDKYELVRLENGDERKIGMSKVVQVRQNKVALEFTLFDLDIKLNKNDKVKY